LRTSGSQKTGKRSAQPVNLFFLQRSRKKNNSYVFQCRIRREENSQYEDLLRQDGRTSDDDFKVMTQFQAVALRSSSGSLLFAMRRIL
jgi:hypothetical protein